MEESLINKISDEFDLKEIDAKEYSSLPLAYIGDGVFDLIIRTLVVAKGNLKASKLHHITSGIVKAPTQAKMIESVLDILNEEEMAVYKRGRNHKSNTQAKNASIIDYRKATGFESLIGYLYLENKNDRLLELIKTAIDRIGVKV